MIYHCNVYVIVMLVGRETQFSVNYFPKSKYEIYRTSEFEIEFISEQNQQDFSIRQFILKDSNGYRIRTIVHLQYTTWNNIHLPLNTSSFISKINCFFCLENIHLYNLDFIHMADTFRRHYGETNPCLVHCTAG